jgi:hypothetical protein
MRGFVLSATMALAALMLTATGAVASDSPLAMAGSLVTADAQSLSGGSSADIYGVGGGKVDGGLQQFDMSAHEGPNGDFGHVSVTFTDPLGHLIVSYSINVTCVHIHTLTSSRYDRGVIKGVVKNVTPVPNLLGLVVGSAVDFGIKDGGNPSAGVPVDDFYAPGSEGVPPGLSCKLFFYTGTLSNVTQGNVNIKGP